MNETNELPPGTASLLEELESAYLRSIFIGSAHVPALVTTFYYCCHSILASLERKTAQIYNFAP